MARISARVPRYTSYPTAAQFRAGVGARAAVASYRSALAGRALDELVREGLCAIEGTRISVPHEARHGVRLVVAAFDRYLAPSAGRPPRPGCLIVTPYTASIHVTELTARNPVGDSANRRTLTPDEVSGTLFAPRSGDV